MSILPIPTSGSTRTKPETEHEERAGSRKIEETTGSRKVEKGEGIRERDFSAGRRGRLYGAPREGYGRHHFLSLSTTWFL